MEVSQCLYTQITLIIIKVMYADMKCRFAFIHREILTSFPKMATGLLIIAKKTIKWLQEAQRSSSLWKTVSIIHSQGRHGRCLAVCEKRNQLDWFNNIPSIQTIKQLLCLDPWKELGKNSNKRTWMENIKPIHKYVCVVTLSKFLVLTLSPAM